jgi:hypothetical protein
VPSKAQVEQSLRDDGINVVSNSIKVEQRIVGIDTFATKCRFCGKEFVPREYYLAFLAETESGMGYMRYACMDRASCRDRAAAAEKEEAQYRAEKESEQARLLDQVIL